MTQPDVGARVHGHGGSLPSATQLMPLRCIIPEEDPQRPAEIGDEEEEENIGVAGNGIGDDEGYCGLPGEEDNEPEGGEDHDGGAP